MMAPTKIDIESAQGGYQYCIMLAFTKFGPVVCPLINICSGSYGFFPSRSREPADQLTEKSTSLNGKRLPQKMITTIRSMTTTNIRMERGRRIFFFK